ncbi:Uncharacterised protein [Mycobacteroides abscessus subsp. massiliense]|nr:Uncharacterised protein [Mycobacteroides abscessus subsp. massiliense]
MRGIHAGGVPGTQLLTIHIDHRRFRIGGDGGDEQRRLGHTVRRLDRVVRQPVWAEGRVELPDRRNTDRLGAVDQPGDIAQIQGLTLLR